MKRYKKQANETGDDDIDREIMNDRLKGIPSHDHVNNEDDV